MLISERRTDRTWRSRPVASYPDDAPISWTERESTGLNRIPERFAGSFSRRITGSVLRRVMPIAVPNEHRY